MITELKAQNLLLAPIKTFRATIIARFNEMARAINVGVVWENKVEAERSDLEIMANSVEAVMDELHATIGEEEEDV